MQDKNIFDSAGVNIGPEYPFSKPVLIYGSQGLTNNVYPWTCKAILSIDYLIRQDKTRYTVLTA